MLYPVGTVCEMLLLNEARSMPRMHAYTTLLWLYLCIYPLGKEGALARL